MAESPWALHLAGAPRHLQGAGLRGTCRRFFSTRCDRQAARRLVAGGLARSTRSGRRRRRPLPRAPLRVQGPTCQGRAPDEAQGRAPGRLRRIRCQPLRAAPGGVVPGLPVDEGCGGCQRRRGNENFPGGPGPPDTTTTGRARGSALVPCAEARGGKGSLSRGAAGGAPNRRDGAPRTRRLHRRCPARPGVAGEFRPIRRR
mmetsp:Transcript_71293/g.206766  ORF Transcript_71293/g.206766 Transcript_71293/m.206766 type:complete len:201 (-) Transcript_71293:1050-1652(-)